MKKWIPLIIVLLFAVGAVVAMLYLPETTQGPAPRAAATARPTTQLSPLEPPTRSDQRSAQQPSAQPGDSDGDEIAPEDQEGQGAGKEPSLDSAPDDSADSDLIPQMPTIDEDQEYPTPFATPDHRDAASGPVPRPTDRGH